MSNWVDINLAWSRPPAHEETELHRRNAIWIRAYYAAGSPRDHEQSDEMRAEGAWIVAEIKRIDALKFCYHAMNRPGVLLEMRIGDVISLYVLGGSLNDKCPDEQNIPGEAVILRAIDLRGVCASLSKGEH